MLFRSNPKSTVSMYYKFYKGFELVKASGIKYDMVVRTRPDLIVNQNIINLDPSKFYTLDQRNYLGQGTGTDFQAGSYDDIEKFCNTFINLDAAYAYNNSLCPHALASSAISLMGADQRHTIIPASFSFARSPYRSFLDVDENKKSTIFYIGSNDLNAARNYFSIKNNIEMHSFEPINEVYNWAAQNVKDTRIIQNNYAAHITDGEAYMHVSKWGNWNYSSLYSLVDRLNYMHNGQQKVNTIRLDTYCNNNNIEVAVY